MAEKQYTLLSVFPSYTICIDHQVTVSRENDQGEIVKFEREPQRDLRFVNHKAVVDQATFDKIRAKFDECDYGVKFMSVNDLYARYKNKDRQGEANGFMTEMYERGCIAKNQWAETAGPLYKAQSSFTLSVMEFMVETIQKQKAAEEAEKKATEEAEKKKKAA